MDKLYFSDWRVPSNIKIIMQLTPHIPDIIDHTHDFVEIFYVVEGCAKHHYNGKFETCEIGDMFLLLPDEMHGFRKINNENFIHRDIVISKDMFKQACDYLGDSVYNEIINGEKSPKVKITGSMIEKLENLITDINLHRFDIRNSTNNMFLLKSKVFLVELLSIYYNNGYNGDYSSPSWLKIILQKFNVKQYVKGGISSILEGIHFDKSYICRVFKKYVGCSMTQYLLNVRLENAVSLLKTTDLTIAEICDEIGIESVPYLTVAFKKKYGHPPRYFSKHGE